ncbi:hypothetical protein TKK_0015915 [Trichogramma kaykai]|uniref:Uncharacterized protein n=1 Tax=Trichogramma kaykai TaxID=54128 RepID=A0ABD2W8G5_9HYME
MASAKPFTSEMGANLEQSQSPQEHQEPTEQRPKVQLQLHKQQPKVQQQPAQQQQKGMTLPEAVMWGNAKQVCQLIALNQGVSIDEKWTDYALLNLALKKRRRQIAKILITEGCRVHKPNLKAGVDTPLHYAVKEDIDMVQMMLDRGAEISQQNEHGETPLMLAAKLNKPEVVDLILNKFSSNLKNIKAKDKFSHFFVACIKNKTDIIKHMMKESIYINEQVDLNATMWAGYTALHFAVLFNSFETIKLLLSHKADVTIKNADHMTALHLAYKKNNETAIGLLLDVHEKNFKNPVDGNGFSHFHIACLRNHLKAVKNFVGHGVDINHAVKINANQYAGYTPLHFAIKALSVNGNSQKPLIEYLVKQKADVNARDAQNETPLHLACFQPEHKVNKYAQHVDNASRPDTESNTPIQCEKFFRIIDQIELLRIVDLLLNCDSDVNACNYNDETPAFFLFRTNYGSRDMTKKRDKYANAVSKMFNSQRYDVLKLLVERGLDVNHKDDRGMTLLHHVMDLDEHQLMKEDMVKLLIEHGADVNAKSLYGPTPLHLAVNNGHDNLIELLVDSGADVNAIEKDYGYRTPLHMATVHRQEKTILHLIRGGADPSRVTSNGMSVIHLVALDDHMRLKQPKSTSESPIDPRLALNGMLRAVLMNGCDIDMRDKNGRSALLLAAWELNHTAASILMDYFADANIRDNAGETCCSLPLYESESIAYYFYRYIQKLKIANFPLSDQINDFYNANTGCHPELTEDLIQQLREELEKMKSAKINFFCSFYDLMFKNSMYVEQVLDTPLFKSSLDSIDQIYPNFGKRLITQYGKGLARRRQMRKAETVLAGLFNNRVSTHAVEKILKYLDDETLSNIIKSNDPKFKFSHPRQAMQEFITTPMSCNQDEFIMDSSTYLDNKCESRKQAIAYCNALMQRKQLLVE